MASINWMFVEGLLLHTKLSGVFSEGPPFPCYYAIGWGEHLFYFISSSHFSHYVHPITFHSGTFVNLLPLHGWNWSTECNSWCWDTQVETTSHSLRFNLCMSDRKHVTFAKRSVRLLEHFSVARENVLTLSVSRIRVIFFLYRGHFIVSST